MTDNFQNNSGNLERTCKDSVVKVDQPWHIVCFILNVFVSGSGTIISALMDSKGPNMVALVFGCCQFMFAWLVLPWIWSIIHGYYIYEKGERTWVDDARDKFF